MEYAFVSLECEAKSIVHCRDDEALTVTSQKVEGELANGKEC
jgi:hypothetical protein